MRVVAGDVGGTNLRLALVEDLPGREPRVLQRALLPAAQQAGLEGPLREFLGTLEGPSPEALCLAVAATLSADGRQAQGVNLEWRIDADALSRACGLPLTLLNDFHAAARGVECLAAASLSPLCQGRAEPGCPRAILGAGTGLGQALLLPEGQGWRVVSGEGGHRGFAPATPTQDRLLHSLRASLGGRVSTERVLSGPGLLATYRFLVLEGRGPCLDVEEAPPHERPAAVTRAGLGGHSTCREALTIFAEVYGAEAGNLALSVLARGGVYLAGGIAPQVFSGQPELQESFRREFQDKGRFRGLLSQVPVFLIREPDLGLLGAAREARLRADC